MYCMHVSSTAQYNRLRNNIYHLSLFKRKKKELFKPSKHFFSKQCEPSDWKDVNMQGSTCVVAGDVPPPGSAVLWSLVSSSLADLQFQAAMISLGRGESQLTK